MMTGLGIENFGDGLPVLVAAPGAVKHNFGTVCQGGTKLIQVGEGVGGFQGGDHAL